MSKIQKTNYSKIVLAVSIAWVVVFFALIPHLIELPNLLESYWTSRGLVYYRDFATFHFPLGRWVLTPLYLAFNWNLQVGPYMGLMLNILCLLLIYKLGKKFLDDKSTSLAIVFFTAFSWFLGTGVMFYHEMFIGFLLLLIFLVFAKASTSGINKKNAFILGLLSAITEFSGQVASPTIITIFALFVGFIFFKTKFKKTLIYILFFTSGALIPTALLTFYFNANNALREFFVQNVLYYTIYAGTYEKVPWSSLPISELVIFYLPAMAASCLIIYYLIRGTKVNFLFFSSTVLSLSTIPFIIFSVFHFHHVSYALPLAAITTGFLFYELAQNNKYLTISKLITVVLLSLLLLKIFPWYLQSSNLKNLTRIANNMTTGDTMYQTVEWVKNNTAANSTILVAGDPLFYFSSGRLPSGNNVYVSPYNWEPLSRTFQEVDAHLPDYWIINRTYFQRLTKEYKKEKMVEYINNSLRAKYLQKAVFDDWEIWQKAN